MTFQCNSYGMLLYKIGFSLKLLKHNSAAFHQTPISKPTIQIILTSITKMGATIPHPVNYDGSCVSSALLEFAHSNYLLNRYKIGVLRWRRH